MTVQFIEAGVPLFKSSGVPAMDADCCCGDPCFDVIPPCKCAEGDFPLGLLDATLHITIPSDSSECFFVGFNAAPPCAVVPGYDFSGTYVVECSESVSPPNLGGETLERVFTFICQARLSPFGGPVYDIYVLEELAVTWGIRNSLGGEAAIVGVLFRSHVVPMHPGQDPYTQPPAVDFSGFERRRQYFYRLLQVNTEDACGLERSDRYQCGTCVFWLTEQTNGGGAIDRGSCSHSTPAEDYAPTVIYIGAP